MRIISHDLHALSTVAEAVLFPFPPGETGLSPGGIPTRIYAIFPDGVQWRWRWPMAVPMQKQLVSIDEFFRMAQAGAFSGDERVELIRGEIVEMSPIGDPHAYAVMMVVDALAVLRSKAILNPQNPLRLPRQTTVPQPDVALLRRRHDFKSRPPHPEDVLLVVEVADSSLAYDRDTKMPLYAEAGISEAWLVDLNSDVIRVHRRPLRGRYQEVRDYRRGEVVEFQGERFSVDDLLG
jgi:Uma2 family endonuclease